MGSNRPGGGYCCVLLADDEEDDGVSAPSLDSPGDTALCDPAMMAINCRAVLRVRSRRVTLPAVPLLAHSMGNMFSAFALLFVSSGEFSLRDAITKETTNR